jgi:hypothetical protein
MGAGMAADDTANPEKAPHRLTEIVVVRQAVARFVIDRYWLLISISLLAYAALHSVIGPPLHPFLGKHGFMEQLEIDLSFYPMDLLVGGLVKSLLQRKIPSTFARLRDTGALDEKAVPELTDGFVNRLNHFGGDALGVVFGLVIFGGFYRFGIGLTVPKLGYIYYVASITVMTIDVLLAYAGGVAIWKVRATMRELRQLGRRDELRARPFYPDGCGGLAAIGRLFFSLSFVLSVFGLFCGGWLLYGRWINPGFGAIDDYAPWFAGSLIVFIGVSVAVFLLPLLDVHRLMKKEAERHETQLLALAGRIADLEESLLSFGTLASHEDLEARLAQIDDLRKTYLEQRNIPTWPVDFETRWKFLTAQAGLWISLPTSALDLWEKWEKANPLSSKSF